MRPFIDINNLSYSEETLIYYSRTNIVFRVLFLIFCIVIMIYHLIEQDDLFICLVLLGISVFQIFILVKSIKRIDEIQFRINKDGICYRNQILVSWNNIENERVITEYTSDDNSNDYFIYYIIDSDKIMRFNIAKLNVSKRELQHTLTIHRNRFNRENSTT